MERENFLIFGTRRTKRHILQGYRPRLNTAIAKGPRHETKRTTDFLLTTNELNSAGLSMTLASLKGEEGLNRAEAVINTFRQHGKELNGNHYVLLLAMALKAGRWTSALSFVEELRERRIVPNRDTYAAMMVTYEQLGKWEAAMQLIEEVKEESPISKRALGLGVENIQRRCGRRCHSPRGAVKPSCVPRSAPPARVCG